VLDNTRPASVSWTLRDRMNRIENCLITDCLQRHNNQVNDAAEELGIPSRTLYNKLKALNEIEK